jgi:hypothetical protein
MLLQRALVGPWLSGGAPLAASLLLHAPRHRAAALPRLVSGHELRAALSGRAGVPAPALLRLAARSSTARSPLHVRLLSSAPGGGPAGGGATQPQPAAPTGAAKPAVAASGSSSHSGSGAGNSHSHDGGGDHGGHDGSAHPDVSFFASPIGWWRANNAKVKRMMAAYGYVTVATYLGVYVVTLSGLFALVSAGAVKGPDVNAFINGWFVKKAVLGDTEVHIPPAWGDFATAWVLTKMTEPFRLVATIGVVPAVVRRAPTGLLRALRVPDKVLAKRATEAAKASASKKAAALVAAALGLPQPQQENNRDAAGCSAAAAGAGRR